MRKWRFENHFIWDPVDSTLIVSFHDTNTYGNYWQVQFSGKMYKIYLSKNSCSIVNDFEFQLGGAKDLEHLWDVLVLQMAWAMCEKIVSVSQFKVRLLIFSAHAFLISYQNVWWTDMNIFVCVTFCLASLVHRSSPDCTFLLEGSFALWVSNSEYLAHSEDQCLMIELVNTYTWIDDFNLCLFSQVKFKKMR